MHRRSVVGQFQQFGNVGLLEEKVLGEISTTEEIFGSLKHEQSGSHYADDIFIAFCEKKTFPFRFHSNSFLRTKSTINQHWVRQWFRTEQTSSHYTNQWWTSSLACVSLSPCLNESRKLQLLQTRLGPSLSLDFGQHFDYWIISYMYLWSSCIRTCIMWCQDA